MPGLSAMGAGLSRR